MADLRNGGPEVKLMDRATIRLQKGDPGRLNGIQIFLQMSDVEKFPLRYSLRRVIHHHTHTFLLHRGIRVSRLSKIGIRATNLFGFPPRRWERCKVNRYRRDDKKKRKNRGKKNHRGFRSSDEPLALIKASEINREQTGICFFFILKCIYFKRELNLWTRREWKFRGNIRFGN